jgi:hypothetical protein
MNVGLTSLCRGHASLPCIIPISFITFHVGAVCPGLAWIMESLTWVCTWTFSWTLWDIWVDTSGHSLVDTWWTFTGWHLVDIHWLTFTSGQFWTFSYTHSRHIVDTCFLDVRTCLESVWDMFEKCLGHVWKVFGKCWTKFGETFWTSVWGWSGGCLGLVWDLSGKCLESVWKVF